MTFRFLHPTEAEKARAAAAPPRLFHCPGCPDQTEDYIDPETKQPVIDTKTGKPKQVALNLKPYAEAKHLVLPHDHYESVHTLCADCARRAEEEAGHQHGKDTFVCEQCRGVTRVPGVLLCPQFVPGHEHYESHKLNQPVEKYLLCETCARPTLDECAARWKKMQEAKK